MDKDAKKHATLGRKSEESETLSENVMSRANLMQSVNRASMVSIPSSELDQLTERNFTTSNIMKDQETNQFEKALPVRSEKRER